MKGKLILGILLFYSLFISTTINQVQAQTTRFNRSTDFLLVHFDCKTDVDDLQSMAALATLLANPNYSNINYHAVTGTYGVQEGLYVPPNALLELAFKGHWTDAHKNVPLAVNEVLAQVKPVLENHGAIWIADAGQSDFTAKLIKTIRANFPKVITEDRIHVVQHSDWNESVTYTEALRYVKKYSDYNKIADGNGLNNGTPGFKDSTFTHWNTVVTDPKLVDIWELSIKICNRYNGKHERYLNEAIAAGGLDFSDLSEVCWILGIEDIKDISDFFSRVLN
jgi:hypothetical protein